MPARALAPITLALLVGFFACLLFAKPGVTLPGGFIEDHVTDVPMPTALAFTPDDRMLVTSKSGQLYVYENENGQRTRALNIGPWVCDNSERGLLGVAVDRTSMTTATSTSTTPSKSSATVPTSSPPAGGATRSTGCRGSSCPGTA
jgi:glucose/sorbosone dehydrogenase